MAARFQRKMQILMGWTVGLVCLALFVLFLYWYRAAGIIRGPLMMFYRHPVLFTLPALVFLGAMLVHAVIKTLFGDHYKKQPKTMKKYYSYRCESYEGSPLPRITGACWTGLALAVVAFFVAIIWTGGWTGDSIYSNTTYGTISPSLLSSMQARIKPYEVAGAQVASSLNSSSENPDNLGIGLVNGKITWTAINDPNGTFRSYTHGANGIISVAGESSEPNAVAGTKQTNGVFKYSPGSKLGKNFGWHAHKICYTCDITEVVGVPASKGAMLVAPFVKWEGGWFVKHPVFKGVFVEHAGGPMLKLTVAQAEANPELVAFGHIFPAGLALRIAQAYEYKNGIANKMWTHKEQLEVATIAEEVNEQPYFEDFKQIGPQWVTTLKPNGQTYTAGAIIMTSAITGQTRIWKTAKSYPVVDGEKANLVALGETGLGLTINDVVEPRQVFPPGRGLEYLTSAISEESTRISVNLVIDAHTQSVIGVFQPNAVGDADLARYLSTGRLPTNQQFNGAGAGRKTGLTSTPVQEIGNEVGKEVPGQVLPKHSAKTTPPSAALSHTENSSALATIEHLIATNRKSQLAHPRSVALQKQQAELEGLLVAAEKAAKH